MGLALGVEAAAGLAEGAEAAEAATTAATGAGDAIIASGEDAEGIIASGGDAGAEAGTKAGTQAGTVISKVGDTLGTAFKTLQTSLSKTGKMVEHYIIMDQVFKAAKDILQGQASDPAARARVQKLGKLVPVLSESIALIRSIASWLQAHAKDTVTLAGQQIAVDQGVLAKFLAPLGAVSISYSHLPVFHCAQKLMCECQQNVCELGS